MDNSYHQNGAPPVPAQMLIEFNQKALKQDDEILAIYQARRDSCPFHTSWLSPSQVWEKLGQGCPLTSVRRSLCNLTKRGLLRKTGASRQGLYGKAENYWELEEAKKAEL